MARQVSVGQLQAMQRAGSKGPNHVAMGESDALGDAAQNGHDVASVDPMTGQLVDAAASRPPGFRSPALPVPEQIAALVLQDDISGMPLGQVVGLVRLAVAKAHVNATESEIRDEAERRWRTGVDEGGPVEPKPEDQIAERLDSVARAMAHSVSMGLVDAVRVTPSDGINEPTMARELISLNVEAQCTAEMPLSLIRARVLEASYGMHPAPSNGDIDAEADRIWSSFDENRAGPAERKPGWRQVVQDRVVEVGLDGVVVDVRDPEMTPDRGPDVGTTVHTVTDDEPRYSGAGARMTDGPTMCDLIPADRDFNGKGYRDAPELANLAEVLIERHGFFEHLEHAEIRYFWKRKTGVVNKRRITGGKERAGGLKGFVTGADFWIWLAADTARERQFSDRRVERALFRLLMGIGQNDKGNFVEQPPDLVLHTAEITHYADAGDEDLVVGHKAFKNADQMGLFADDDEDLDDEDDEIEYSDASALRDIDKDGTDDEPADPDQPYDEEPGTADDLADDPLADPSVI